MKIPLDHVGIAAHSLAQARASFERLGFRMTELSVHSGSLGPGLPIEPWGTANHCAMFRHGYLETLGPHGEGESRIKRVQAMLARYEGPHIVAFRCDDAEQCHRELLALGAPVEPIKQLERMAPFGSDGQQERLAQFRLVGLASPPYVEARVQITEHRTPEVIWQPHLLDHPNSATAITDVVFKTDDADATALRYGTHLGGTLSRHRHGIRVDLARGSLHFVTAREWALWRPGAPVLPTPSPVALGFSVASRDALVSALAAGKVEWEKDDVLDLVVDGGAGHGATLFFRA